MRITINALVWLAAFLNRMAAHIFAVALKLALPKEPAPVEETKEALEEEEDDLDDPETVEDLVSTKPDEDAPLFRAEDGSLIPITMEPLPDFQVFSAMFERKYGKFGRMPMTIAGQPRSYTVQELYTLLAEIDKLDAPNSTMVAVYGSIMNVVMRAYGEKLDIKQMN